MAKTYAESVKLPNLVVNVPHPSKRYMLTKNGLNVEGRNNSASFNNDDFNRTMNKNQDRKAYISSLIGDTDDSPNNKFKKYGDLSQCSIEQIMDLISERLTTGINGVKHLFKSNDLYVTGKLSKESFKCVLHQLCGYISAEAWSKIVAKFRLNESDSISYAEFLSYFDNNQRVKKELASLTSNNVVEMVDISRAPLIEIMSQRDMSKKIALPELSATYCYSLIKAKARASDFDPAKYLPEECIKNNLMIIPFHLRTLLNAWNLKLSDAEFQKLWLRFDINNTGGVKANVFLRLMDYKPNQIDDLTANMDKLRTKSCIVDKLVLKDIENKRKSSYLMNNNNNNKSITKSNRNMQKLNQTIVDTPRTVDTSNSQKLTSSKSFIDFRNNDDNDNLTSVSFRSEKKPDNNDLARSKSGCESSMSEVKIKSMVHMLKNSNKFSPNEDLVSFLNNKLNQGFLSLKTAFEYIDPDHLGHLLTDEFRIVLEEFGIYVDSKSYQKFLKKYGLLKHNQLVDYQKFLDIFQDQGPNSITKSAYLQKTDQLSSSNKSYSVKDLENKLVDYFHEQFLIVLNHFKQSNMDNKVTCSVDAFKKLLEQKFSIQIEPTQFESLLLFMNQLDESQKTGQVNWSEMFKKFSEIDPWKYFKESCENYKISKKSPKMSNSVTPLLTPSRLKAKNKLNQSLKENDSTIREEDETVIDQDTNKNSEHSFKINHEKSFVNESDFENLKEIDYSSDEDEIKQIDSSSDDEEIRKEKLSLNTAFISSKKFKNELKIIRKLEKKVENIFRTKFHSLNKQYGIIDQKHTEKLDKQMFNALMIRLGAKLTDTEIDLLWKDFEAETIPFSNLVRRFFKPDEFSRLRNIKFKIKLEKQFKEQRSKTFIGITRSDLNKSFDSFVSNENDQNMKSFKKNSNDGKQMNQNLIEKAKHSIITNLNELKKKFQRADKNYSTHIPNTLAADILKTYNVPLDGDELINLCKIFNLNGAEFNYIRFLKFFNKSKSASDNYNLNACLTSNISWNSINSILKQIIFKLRELHPQKSIESDMISKDFLNLRLLFKKFDTSRKGHLSQAELKKLLAHCQLNSNSDEVLMTLAEFDPDLKGVFTYELAFKYLIDKAVTTID